MSKASSQPLLERIAENPFYVLELPVDSPRMEVEQLIARIEGAIRARFPQLFRIFIRPVAGTRRKVQQRKTTCLLRAATLGAAGKGETAGEEPTALPVTETARQTPSGARPHKRTQGAEPKGAGARRVTRPSPRVGCSRRPVTDALEE